MVSSKPLGRESFDSTSKYKDVSELDDVKLSLIGINELMKRESSDESFTEINELMKRESSDAIQEAQATHIEKWVEDHCGSVFVQIYDRNKLSRYADVCKINHFGLHGKYSPFVDDLGKIFQYLVANNRHTLFMRSPGTDGSAPTVDNHYDELALSFIIDLAVLVGSNRIHPGGASFYEFEGEPDSPKLKSAFTPWDLETVLTDETLKAIFELGLNTIGIESINQLTDASSLSKAGTEFPPALETTPYHTLHLEGKNLKKILEISVKYRIFRGFQFAEFHMGFLPNNVRRAFVCDVIEKVAENIDNKFEDSDSCFRQFVNIP